jgi:biotin carboxyl carrier protein
VHATAEAWYRDERPDWTSLPGQILLSGAGYLPHPDRCERVEVERAIGDEPTGLVAPRSPTTITIHGVRWGGFIDLVAWPTRGERERLWPAGVLVGPVLIDHKTTASIARYAKTPDELTHDVAAAVYGVDVMTRYGLDALACRWVYYESKRVRRAVPVDFALTGQGALDTIAPAAELARHLDTIERSADATCNSLACDEYGGCPYHPAQGGPCDVRRGLAAAFANPRRQSMALTDEDKAKFAALQKAAPATPTADAPAEAPAAPAETTAPAKSTRKRKGSAPTPVAAGAPGDFAARKAAAEQKIAEGQAELAQVVAEIAAQRDALTALLGVEG